VTFEARAAMHHATGAGKERWNSKNFKPFPRNGLFIHAVRIVNSFRLSFAYSFKVSLANANSFCFYRKQWQYKREKKGLGGLICFK